MLLGDCRHKMDKRLVAELIKTRQAVKRKYRNLQSDMTRSQLELSEQFKPISQPLQELIETIKSEGLQTKDTQAKVEPSEVKISPPKLKTARYGRRFERTPEFLRTDVIAEALPEEEPLEVEGLSDAYGDVEMSDTLTERYVREATKDIETMMQPEVLDRYLESFTGIARQYVEELIRDTEGKFDLQYGVRFNIETDKFSIGNKELEFEGENMYIMDGKSKVSYTATPGFYELMFKKVPSGFTKTDLANYRDIVKRSAANHKKYNPREQISGNIGSKYQKVVKSLFTNKQDSSGRGFLNVNNKNVEFVPWKNPNTLVERLKILIASQAAGHTGHHNEIVSIENALRRAKVIEWKQ